MDDRFDTDALAALIARKLRVLLQLRELTLRQPALIAAHDTSTLLRVFAAKQKLLEEVQRVDRLLEPFRGQDPEQRVWRSSEERERCRLAAAQCHQLVQEIKASEMRDRDDLVEQREAVSRELEQAHAVAAARVAYEPTTATGHLDLSSEG